jgi:hypothetical protein
VAGRNVTGGADKSIGFQRRVPDLQKLASGEALRAPGGLVS